MRGLRHHASLGERQTVEHRPPGGQQALIPLLVLPCANELHLHLGDRAAQPAGHGFGLASSVSGRIDVGDQSCVGTFVGTDQVVETLDLGAQRSRLASRVRHGAARYQRLLRGVTG